MTKDKAERPEGEKRKHLFFSFNGEKKIMDEKVHPLLTKICVPWHSNFPCHFVLSYSK